MTNQSEKIDLLATALAIAQKKMGRALKDSENPFFKSKYADLASIMDACMGVLNVEGISVTQMVSSSEGNTFLVTRLMHSSGQFIESSCPLFIDKSKNAMHALGSAITYARRYSLAAICGVAQEDDDGNASGNGNGKGAAKAPEPTNPPLTKDEVIYLDDMIGNDEEYRSCVMNFILKGFNAKELKDIPREIYKKILPVAEKKYQERLAA